MGIQQQRCYLVEGNSWFRAEPEYSDVVIIITG